MNPVLLLHGALGSSSQLEPLKKKLESEGREVYTLNFSGHSGVLFSVNGFGIEEFAKDVLQFLEQKSIKQVNIFGYSMGDYVAVWLAQVDPHLIGKVVTLGTKFDWDPESAQKEVKKLNPEKILEKVPGFARILEHRHAPNDWRELLSRTSKMMTGLGARPLLTEEIFRAIEHNIIILLGDQDDIADREFSIKVSEWLPNGRFVLLKNTPHPIEKVAVEDLVWVIFQKQ